MLSSSFPCVPFRGAAPGLLHRLGGAVGGRLAVVGVGGDVGVVRVSVVANKVRDGEDEDFIRARVPEEDFLGFIHYNADVIDADRHGQSPYDFSPQAVEEIRAIKAKMDAREARE